MSCPCKKGEKTMKRYSFRNVNAVYTGGGIWLFYGELSTGEHFLTDDYGFTLILDESPADFDESLYEEWQHRHTIKELVDSQRVTFCDKLANRLLRHNKADNLGGIADYEIRRYKEYWRLPM